MIKYLIKRLAISLIQIWAVITVIFLFIHALPGDPVDIILGANEAFTPTEEQRQMVREQMGFDRPLHVQYLSYFEKLLKGDFGKSFYTKRPVGMDLTLRIGRSLQLILPGVLLSSIIGISLGVVTARHQKTFTDLAISTLGLVAHSMPVFVLGNFLILAFSIQLGWLPSSGYKPLSAGIMVILYMILPVVTMGTRGAATSMRMTRMSIVEQVLMDYVRTAKAKGLSQKIVLRRHVLRNALLPVVTVIGMQLGAMFGSSVIVEAMFNWPGLSSFLVNAINSRDYPVIQGCMLALTSMFVLINLLTDLSYAVLDPRISVG